ncbi:helix-turn-helix domain-containing protein, partial [Streptococcus sobrinus]
MIDRRLIDLIKHLVTEQTTNLSRLESSLNLTRRQVTYILDKLNDLFVENQLPTLNYKESTIEITKGHHNFLVQTLGNSKILADYLMNSDERLRFLFLLLVALDEDYLSLADFLAILKVSKTTVLVDLKKLEKILGKRGIRIVYSREKGYELEGNELAVRNLLFDWLTKDISEGMSQIYDIYLSQFKRVQIQDYLQLIQTLRHSFSIELVESRTIELAYFIVLILNRLKRNLFHEEAFTSVNLLGFAEYKFIETLLTKLEVDDTREVEYLTALILGQSVGNRDAISPDRALILNLT